MDIKNRYHIEDLVAASGISRRTIHYYISKGLLPHAQGSGRNGYYTQVHMDRLLRIRQLRDQFVVLKDIREILDEEERQRQTLSIREEGPQYDADGRSYPVSITITMQNGIQVTVPIALYTSQKDQIMQALQALEHTLSRIAEDEK